MRTQCVLAAFAAYPHSIDGTPTAVCPAASGPLVELTRKNANKLIHRSSAISSRQSSPPVVKSLHSGHLWRRRRARAASRGPGFENHRQRRIFMSLGFGTGRNCAALSTCIIFSYLCPTGSSAAHHFPWVYRPATHQSCWERT